MPSYKALFLDIDGTILRDDHSIEDSTKEAVQLAKEQEIEVFLATGRPLHELQEIAEYLQVESFIGYNGAYALQNDEVLVDEPMDAQIINHYLDIAKHYGHDMVLYTNKQNLFTSIESKQVQEFIEYFDLKSTSVYSKEYQEQILGITLMNVPVDEIDFYQIENVDIYFSQVNVKGLEHCYDVIRENVNKGRAIKHILEKLNISPSKAIAFGDGMNDKQMLQFVGTSFAMGNASPELFQYAKHRTTSVNDSGIYNGLKQIGVIKE
ncbi:HAD family hydrolase [Gracilibacillus sp. YIM 98692]|uniref:HAD family hydrolase n=1 Tax=Gracilibacillus sp. YIM 98692 TaxID=2663532 RepID=UPI0013D5E9A1|nr:HAD family hydrolase [Gracilibacillus sp. YIM 98692]